MSAIAKLNLFPYQEESVKQIDDFDGRALVALEPGLGKTAITLQSLSIHSDRLPALVVCPASVKFNWAWEASHYFGIQSSVCEGEQPLREDRFRIKDNITIINYDILQHWAEYLRRQQFKTIIMDECQYVSNPETRRTKAAKYIAAGTKFILPLSGTPLLNRPIELFTVLNLLWPKEFPNKAGYARQYCNRKWTRWGWDDSGSSNLGELHRRLLTLGMIRYRKKDVLKDLPPKVRRIIPVEISDRAQYEYASKDFINWLKENKLHRVRSASKAVQLTRLGYLLELVAKLKIRGVVDWANRFLEETDEKLILFAIHKKAVDVLQRRINGKSVVIDGSITGQQRFKAVEQFQKDKSTRLCVANIHAGGIGVTLSAASELGIMEFPWRPGDILQAEDRPHRIGQTNTVFVNFFIALGTLEEKLCRTLEDKQGVVSSVLDGGKTSGDLNLHEMLLKEIEGDL